MPIEATPFEQDVAAEATNLTEEPTVLPLPGLDTETLAEAGTDAKTNKIIGIRTCLFILGLFSRLECIWNPKEPVKQRDQTRRLRQDTLIVLAANPSLNDP